MSSLRSFLWLWVGITVAICIYAYIDLQIHPALLQERPMTMVPDWEQVGGLVHWGGRLMREQAWHLLLGNAIMLGGLVALIAEGVIGVVRRGLRAGDVGAGQATGLEGS